MQCPRWWAADAHFPFQHCPSAHHSVPTTLPTPMQWNSPHCTHCSTRRCPSWCPGLTAQCASVGLQSNSLLLFKRGESETSKEEFSFGIAIGIVEACPLSQSRLHKHLNIFITNGDSPLPSLIIHSTYHHHQEWASEHEEGDCYNSFTSSGQTKGQNVMTNARSMESSSSSAWQRP